MNTCEILDRVKAEYGLTSDYQLAKKLSISHSRLSNYRHRQSTMDDDLVLTCENLLELPPGSLLIEFQAQLTKCKAAADILHKLAARMMSHAAAVFLVISITYNIGAGLFFEFAPGFFAVHQCILCKIQKTLIWEIFLVFFLGIMGIFAKCKNLDDLGIFAK